MTSSHQISPFDVPVWEAVAHLRETRVGRLCIIDHGTPIALPVNFRIAGRDDDLRIVIRTAPTGLLGAYAGPASLEADQIDERRQRAWSVLARGVLRHEHRDPDLPDPEPCVTGSRDLWLVLEVRAVTARRFTGAPSADGFAVEWTLTPE
jgi:nitroimidazol reductase NimA-like FMN-containing flavoprotein (pyridoxamine 5'-phosphate oxidase superfamily)